MTNQPIEELVRKWANSLVTHSSSTHLLVEKAEVQQVVALLLHDPPMIDALGNMTERCYKAEAERDGARETAEQRWRERNEARDVARAFFPLVANHPLSEEEDAEDWTMRFPWLAREEVSPM